MNEATRRIAPTVGNDARAPHRLFFALLLVLAVAIAYVNSFGGVFVMDDQPSILTNPSIRSLGWSAWQPPAGDGLTVEARPVVNFSLAINYAISATDPWSYHATNLIIHLVAASTLLGLLRRVLLRIAFPCAENVAFGVALLWALHPLQAQSVTYIVQRAEALMGGFYLGTLYCFVRGIEARPARRPGWFTVAAILCGSGMATKEVMVSAPLIALLIDRTLFAGSFAEVWRQRRWVHLIFFGTWLILLSLQLGHLDRGGTIGTAAGVTWWQYACCQARAILHYVRLGVWPFPLVFDYGSEFVTLGQVWMHGIIDLALVALTLLALYRGWAIGLVGAWFFFILAPTSSFVGGSRQMLAEHRMYLPLVALLLIGVAGLHRVLGARRARWIVGAVAVGLLGTTIARNRDFNSELALYADNFRKRPGEAHSIYNYGYALQQEGRTEQAISLYRAAIRLKPDFVAALDDLANLLAKIPGREDEALRCFEAYLHLRPRSATMRNNAGVLLLRMPGRLPDAIRELRIALELRPDSPEAHLHLAGALAREPARTTEAAAHYEAALRLNPDFMAARFSLGVLLAGLSERNAEAIGHFRTIIQRQPNDARAHYYLGLLTARGPGRQADGIPHFEAALRLQPALAEAHFQLAHALSFSPETSARAEAHYAEAIRLKPDFAEARNALAVILAGRPGRGADAIAQLEAAVRDRPGYAEAHHNLGLVLAQIAHRPEAALTHFAAALKSDPAFADAHFSMGMTLRLLGRATDAVRHFEAALALQPDFPAARAELEQLR